MNKKRAGLLLAFLMCLILAVPVFAKEGSKSGFSEKSSRVSDFAGILTEDEKGSLIKILDEISHRQNMDVAVVITSDLGSYGSPAECAETFFENGEFGYGEEKDGILLLVSMAEHDWYIDTHGSAISAFTDAGIQYIGGQMKPDLADGKYAEAFETYAHLCDKFITQAYEGKPYDSGHMPRQALSVMWIFLSLAIGIVMAGAIVGSMVSGMKSVRTQAMADNYVKEGSFHIDRSQDLFLYHTITRTERPKETKSSGSSGSSTHSSHSGSTHGGGGGKF